MGHTSQYSSLCNYEGDWVVIGTISFLIITGGIGFIVWDDLSRKKLDFRHYMLHTKIVLVTTAVLLITSTILFYLMERNNILVGMNGSSPFWPVSFSAVTPRTAGFNNVDTAALTDGSKFLSAILMFIGGSPGSTAGGIKTSTLAVLLLLRPFQYPPDIRGGDIREKAGGRVHQAVCLYSDHQPGSRCWQPP